MYPSEVVYQCATYNSMPCIIGTPLAYIDYKWQTPRNPNKIQTQSLNLHAQSIPTLIFSYRQKAFPNNIT